MREKNERLTSVEYKKNLKLSDVEKSLKSKTMTDV